MNATRRSGFALLLLAGLFTVFLAGCGEDSVSDRVPGGGGGGGGSAGAPYNIGNDVQFSSGTWTFVPAQLMDWSFNVPSATNLVALNVILNAFDPGTKGMMALYTDKPGVPWNLVAGSAPPQLLVVGVNTFPVVPTPIFPGIYYISIHTDGNYTHWTGPNTANRWNVPLSLGAPWPDPHTAPAGPFPNPEMNIYMTVVD